MEIKKLHGIVISALENMKAQDIRTYNTTHLTHFFDQVTIASGTSNRQTKALATSVRDEIKRETGIIPRIEGSDVGEWVLVDAGYIVVHIMQPIIREYYRLEEIWGTKEIDFNGNEKDFTCISAQE